MQNFATRLIAARLRCALTQQELAARAQVSLRSIQVWENGTMNLPRPNLLRRLCAVLGVTPESLLGEAEPGSGEDSLRRTKSLPSWLEPLHDRLARLDPGRRTAVLQALLTVLDLGADGNPGGGPAT